ncbi:PilN domain-containing protein [Flavobacterium sp. ZT3R18]|uniref:PilN domain-containing protein n=1 Tax=Flavobacterium sp. ZT3R18 TaxID=2594429 RepID=UPI00117A59AC|nr:PilN domain-containing protein [Flavobacterium sp. ZT3R18]TRX33718.1 PilN domain-containing protein [Flavobacterium sp. ZT3R18]
MIPILTKIIKINELHVVGIIKNENEELYHVLTVKKRANKVDIVSMSSFSKFEDLKKNIDQNFPLLLFIDGKGVLNKAIDFNNEADVSWYKNIDLNSIYHTSLKGLNIDFISFSRKNIINDTITKFRKNNFQIIDVYLGAFISAILINSIKKETILSNDLLLEFKNGKLHNFVKQTDFTKKEDYIIGKETITNTYLPLYATVIDFFIQSKEISKAKIETLNTDEIIYKKAFKYLGISILIGFLISLLVSFILIQYYSSKNADLTIQNIYTDKNYQQTLDLEKQKENKQKILLESGFSSSKFLSFYSYEIIKIVPQDVSLTVLEITPLTKEPKINQKLIFESNTINVKGETLNESSFNTWMERLKKMNWLENFEIISFKKDKKNVSQFEVKIAIKNV